MVLGMWLKNTQNTKLLLECEDSFKDVWRGNQVILILGLNNPHIAFSSLLSFNVPTEKSTENRSPPIITRIMQKL